MYQQLLYELRLVVVRPHPAQLLPHLHLIPVLPPVGYETSLLVHDEVASARPVSPLFRRLDPVVILADMRACRFVPQGHKVLYGKNDILSCCLQEKVQQRPAERKGAS